MYVDASAIRKIANTGQIPFRLLLRTLHLRFIDAHGRAIANRPINFGPAWLFVPRQQWFDQQGLRRWKYEILPNQELWCTNDSGEFVLEIPLVDNARLLVQVWLAGYMPQLLSLNVPPGQDVLQAVVKYSVPAGQVQVEVKDAKSRKLLSRVYVWLTPGDAQTRRSYSKWQREILKVPEGLQPEGLQQFGDYSIYPLPLWNINGHRFVMCSSGGYTGADGTVTFGTLPPGVYQLKVWRHVRRIQVQPDRVVKVSVML